MKTILFFIAALFFAQSGFSQGAQAEPKEESRFAKNHFYLSPFNLIASQFLVGYERDINKKHSILLMPGIILSDNNYAEADFGATVEAQYRYHIVAVKNPRGKTKNDFRFNFYMAPFAQYQYLEYSDYSYYDEYGNYVSGESISNAYSGGLLFGTRFTFFERFTLDVYGGGGVKYSVNERNEEYYYYGGGIFFPNYTGIIGKGNIQIGVAF